MYINAMGTYVPSLRIDNDYFKDVNGLTGEWILQRTGISSRSKCAPGENVNTMAFDAVEDARQHLPYHVKDVDLIVAAHYVAYYTVAKVAHQVQRRLNNQRAKAA